MKRSLKALVLIIMVAIFVTLIILPVNLKSETLMQGNKCKYHGVDTCACPGGGDCQCLILTLEEQ